MEERPGGEEAAGFDMVAASIRADAVDLATFMDALAVKLESALPGMVRVQREGGLFKKEHRVTAITIQIEDRIYEVYRSGSGLEARLSHRVQGITLKKEVLHLEAWITELSRHLSRHAQTSSEAHAALERLIT